MGYATDGIGGSTIHTILEINNRARKSFIAEANMLWLQKFSLVIDKDSIIDMKLFTLIDK